MSSIFEEADHLRRKLEEDENQKLRIALFGQPGAGKSSLINAIVGKKVAETGASTDVTVEAQVIPHGDLLFVDLPGYGTSKFPPNEWFEKFEPEEFDLFLCVFAGKFHEADSKFFRDLKEKNRVCLFVRTKHDDIWEDEKTIEELEEEIQADVTKQVGSPQEVYFVSCKNKTGLEHLVDGIKASLEPAKRDKYARSAKAFTMEHLQEKKAACEKLVYRYAGLAAANGLNPIPGLNMGVDLSIMLKLFADIRESYGLTDKKVKNLSAGLLPLGSEILKYATKEGLLLLLKRFASREIVQQTSKYIPFVGPIIAAAAGFSITLAAGKSYLGDCHDLAEGILKEELSGVGV